ncbi:MAG: hypothetical protein M3R70_12870, partial [Actinomycetota bacterium]|nr:hypothetical protein [Actinomycetota bacterium]
MPEIALEALEFALVLFPLAMLVAAGSRHETRATGRTGVELLERHERFLDGAAHELRTPLTIARGHLELLQRGRSDTPELAAALDALGRIERTVESLLQRAAAPPIPEASSRYGDGFCSSGR